MTRLRGRGEFGKGEGDLVSEGRKRVWGDCCDSLTLTPLLSLVFKSFLESSKSTLSISRL